MDKWFNEGLDRKNLRGYTQQHLKKNSLERILKKHSVTTWLIIISAVVFIIQGLLFRVLGEETFYYYLAIQPNAFFAGNIWTLLTSMFMHANFSHLFVNMVSLFFLGGFIEKLIGRKRLFWLYMVAGIFAGLFFVFLAQFFGHLELFGNSIFGSPEVFAVGASGAIFALGGLLAVLTPNLRVYVFFIIPMRMWTAMIGLLGVLWFASISVGLPFGNTAHFGGLLVGLGYGIHLKKRYPRKTQWLAKQFSG